MKVAFVHDWLVTYRGGERVLEALLELYPEAPIFTLFYTPSQMPKSISSRRVITPVGLGVLTPFRKALLPFLPTLIESFDLNDFDLVISTSSCVAKGCIPGPNATHVSYVHSPMRYIWDQKAQYFTGFLALPVVSWFAEWMASQLRMWDTVSATRVDHFIANSQFVAQRIRRYYRRDAVVIAPPVDLNEPKPKVRESSEPGYFLAAGAWVSYKRFDLAIDSCRQAGKKLIIAGSGPLAASFATAAAQSKNTIEIVHAPDRTRWVSLLRGADALLFPGTEEFGVTAVEALSCGTPVIAHRSGGALDFIQPGVNGFFFDSFTAASLASAIQSFNVMEFDPKKVAATADRFGRTHFVDHVREELRRYLKL